MLKVSLSLLIWMGVAGCRHSAPPAPVKPTVAPTSVATGTSHQTVEPPSTTNATLVGFVPTPKLFLGAPPEVKQVALTFDAGADSAAVPLLLQTLTEHHVHCTFFLTGAFCKHFPEQVKMIADAGMELGNHSFHHPKFTTKSDDKIREELNSAEQEIVQSCGRGAKPLFRYPFGDSDKRVRTLVAAEGYQAIQWSVDSLDSVGDEKNADFVVNRILKKLKPGGITLMHVSRIESAKSLPRIFDYLDKQGIQVVPVSQLLIANANAEKEAAAAKAARRAARVDKGKVNPTDNTQGKEVVPPTK